MSWKNVEYIDPLAPLQRGLLVDVPQAAADRVVARPRDAAPVLSFAQERLWSLAQDTPDDPSWNLPLSLRVEGPLDVAALSRALSEIVRRHEVLRTTIGSAGGRPAPVVHPPAPVALRVLRVDADAARAEAAAEARRPFDLAASLPFRAALLTIADDVHQLLVTMHHVVTDGWSLGVFCRELSALYAGAMLPDLPLQYADHAAWQRAFLGSASYEREIAFWAEALGDVLRAPRALELPADRPRPPVPSRRGDRRSFRFLAAVGEALEALACKEGATMFMTLLAAFEVLLHRTTGETSLVVGTPVAGRARAGTEGLIGCFHNNLALRVEVTPELTFRELLGRVRAACLAAFAHQDVPLERLVQALAPERDLGRSPLFRVMFTLQAEPRDTVSLPGLTVGRLRADVPTAGMDLFLAMHAGAGNLGGAVEYDTDLFDADTIDRLVAHLGVLLEGVARDPDATVASLPILPEEERHLVVEAWNATAAPWSEGATLHDLFQAHAARDPAAPALLFEGRVTTYGELDARANRLANHLRRYGVGPESLVGISLRRSPEQIVAALATLKAGGAWVPLDPAYRTGRLAFMIADADLRLIVTEESVAPTLPAPGLHLVRVDGDGAAIARESPALPSSGVTFANKAYVLYTSGSTGRPWGVVVDHHGLGNLAAVHHRALGVGPGARVLQLASFDSGAAVWDLVMALLNGATLVLASQEALLPGPDLLETLRENRVSIMTVPPGVLAALPPAELPDLRTIVVAGEACAQELVDRWQPGRKLFDAYGPTEASLCATLGERCAGQERPTIGKPIANVQIFILDEGGNPAPIGAPGELHVGGVGVARGYLRRPELTAERFVTRPFQAPGRLYKTGDLARWLADGNIEILGRLGDPLVPRGSGG